MVKGTGLSVANGGTGQITYSNGQLLIGNSSNTLTKTTLTQGANISITNGDGSITIAGNYSVGDGGLTQKNFKSALKTKLDNISDNDVIDWTSSRVRERYILQIMQILWVLDLY